MTFTANAAATTAHTIAYSGKALAGTAAAATVTAEAYTVYAAGARPIEIRVAVERNARTRVHTLPTSIPAAVDPLGARASGTTLVTTGSKTSRRAAASQWDH